MTFLCSAIVFLLSSGFERTNVADTTILQKESSKTIPAVFEKPIREALAHFPELENTRIEWRIEKAYTPLSTRPTTSSVFKRRAKRKYIITISNQTIDTLRPLLFQNLEYKQQVGIMGHELSHVLDFQRQRFFRSVRTGIGHLSPKFVDRMEFKTDSICIMHGLGSELESYSRHVREVMHVKNWRGVDYVFRNDQKHERYMNPDTIRKFSNAREPEKKSN